ncbi:MAG TPA: hypothetical protein PLG29_11990, partial [Lentimicrobium sp.]|nr:hypothetical protein [Lentimicrobium sp.]
MKKRYITSETDNGKMRNPASRFMRMVAALLLLLPVAACTDFLTEDLKGDFASDTFFQNDKQAIQAINGVYNAIAFNSFNNAIWVFGDVASDDAVKGGNPGDQA